MLASYLSMLSMLVLVLAVVGRASTSSEDSSRALELYERAYELETSARRTENEPSPLEAVDLYQACSRIDELNLGCWERAANIFIAGEERTEPSFFSFITRSPSLC